MAFSPGTPLRNKTQNRIKVNPIKCWKHLGRGYISNLISELNNVEFEEGCKSIPFDTRGLEVSLGLAAIKEGFVGPMWMVRNLPFQHAIPDLISWPRLQVVCNLIKYEKKTNLYTLNILSIGNAEETLST